MHNSLTKRHIQHKKMFLFSPYLPERLVNVLRWILCRRLYVGHPPEVPGEGKALLLADSAPLVQVNLVRDLGRGFCRIFFKK